MPIAQTRAYSLALEGLTFGWSHVVPDIHRAVALLTVSSTKAENGRLNVNPPLRPASHPFTLAPPSTLMCQIIGEGPDPSFWFVRIKFLERGLYGEVK